MIKKLIIILIICFLINKVKENFTTNLNYIIPENKVYREYQRIFEKILNKIVNRIKINHKVWKIDTTNKNKFNYIKQYITTFIKKYYYV